MVYKEVPNVMELFKLDGQVALVTGGARDLGLQIAQALAEAGANVVITSRSAEAAEKAAVDMSDYTGRQVIGLTLDVTDLTSVHTTFEKVKKTLDRLDILVNNAGGTISSDNYRILDRTLDEWRYTVKVNLDGTFLCTQAAARIMIKQRSGNIINIASIGGMIGRDRSIYEGIEMKPNTVDYAAVKGGIINFTRDAAAELAPYRIRVNCISPGGFLRSQQPEEFVRRYCKVTPLGRMGIDGRDLKGAVVFLASTASDYITGVNLPVDGGFSAIK